jgi:DNA-binding response OmpR family regulator
MPKGRAAASGSLRGIHVFVVDDEPPSLELVSKPLEYHGALVTTCRTLQAPRLMSHVRPNVVVIEVPSADDRAYALVRQIRAAAAKRSGAVPAIALMPRGSRRRTAARGFRASVPQPFHVRELCAAILDVVKSR